MYIDSRTKRIIWACAAGAVLVVMLLAWGVMAARTRRALAQLPVYEQRLNHDDPEVRLDAASHILALQPDRQDARFTEAIALMELSRHGEARQQLDILEKQRPERLAQVLKLHAESCLLDAVDRVDRASEDTADLIAPQVEELLANADRLTKLLEAQPDSRADLLLLQARQFDVRARLLRMQSQAKQAQGRTAATPLQGEADAAVVQAAGARFRLAEMDQKLQSMCRRVLELRPDNAQARLMLFHMWLRNAQYDQARDVADAMASQGNLDPAAAGEVANALLEMEDRYAQAVTPRDLDIAQRIIDHPSLKDAQHPNDLLARLNLLMQKGQYHKVVFMAYDLLQTDAFAGHQQVTCTWALANLKDGQVDDVLGFMQPYTANVTSWRTLYALGAAYLAAGKRALGDETLRQSVELDPKRLAPRLMLAESLVDAGFAVEAGPDIEAAIELNAQHPQVLKLQARLALEKLDSTAMIDLLTRRPAGQPAVPPRWQDLALAAGMVVNDMTLVQRLVDQSAAEAPGDMTPLLAAAWLHAAPDKQGRAASVIVRAMYEQVDSDPLARAEPPTVAVLARLAAGSPPPPQSPAEHAVAALESLSSSHFVPWPEQVALTLVDEGLDRWPDQPTLRALSGQLNLWLGQVNQARQRLDGLSDEQAGVEGVDLMQAYLAGDDAKVEQALTQRSRTGSKPARLRWLQLAVALRKGDRGAAAQALVDLLTDHPWSELALILTVRDALEQLDPKQARAWIALADRVNRKLALLTSARLALAVGEPVEAVHDAEMLLREEQGDSEIRRLAGDVRARANLAMGRPQMAAGLFENLSLALKHEAMPMRVASADALLEGGRVPEATAVLAGLVSDADTPPHWLDRLLVRARAVMEPQRVDNVITTLLQSRTDEPLLLLYQAQHLIRTGNLDDAQATLQKVLDKRPDAPRALVVQAELALARNQKDEARRIYQRLIQQGGRVAQVGRRRLHDLDDAAPAPPTPGAAVEGANP